MKSNIEVTESALKHGLDAEYIQRMWYDTSCKGFEVSRMPPRESNVIAIRFIVQPSGTLEMIAAEYASVYRVFHAQIVSEGKTTSLLAEALALYGFRFG